MERRQPTGFQILRDIVTLILIPIALWMASTLMGLRDDVVLIKHKLDDHASAVTSHNKSHETTDIERESIHHGVNVHESCINCMGGKNRNGNGNGNRIYKKPNWGDTNVGK